MTAEKLEVVNLTPHPVVVISGDAKTEYPSMGCAARLDEQVTEGRTRNGIKFWEVKLGAGNSIPDSRPGVVYVVSLPLLMGLKALGINRDDLVYPYPQVRDETGRIIGCGGLARLI